MAEGEARKEVHPTSDKTWRNAKKSSKSFKSFGDYVRKYPDRKLA